MRDSYEDAPEQAREAGLRRLGRLTWRTTQIGALATVGFAIVFARTAPSRSGSGRRPDCWKGDGTGARACCADEQIGGLIAVSPEM